MNILIIFFSFLLHMSTNSGFGNNEKYIEAYNYVNNCKHARHLNSKICKMPIQFPVNVISEIYPLSVLILGDQIIKDKLLSLDKNNLKLSDFVTKFDKTNDFEPYINNELSSLFPTNTKSQLFIAFSKPIGNILFAELAFSNKDTKVKSIKDITQFNKSLAFLFIFDENNKIKKVYYNVNHYN